MPLNIVRYSPDNRLSLARAMSFSLKLFGGASIETPTGPVTGRAVQRHRLALLALLSTSSARGMGRDKVIAYLWPETDSGRGRHLLSDSVYRINRAVGEDAVFGVGDELRIDQRILASDVSEFEGAAKLGQFARAVELYRGPFLDGFFLPDSSGFDHWMESQRELYDREYVQVVEGLAVDAEARGDPATATGWWRTAALRNPCNTRLALRLMGSLNAARDRAGAIHHAGVHAECLRTELELEPDPEVAALADRLRAIPATDATPSVAVLPFLSLSDDPKDENFADGVTEEIIASLSKVRAVKVISRTSVMQFKSRRHSLREMGTVLGAKTLLDGSVRHDGDQVRIVAALIDTDTGRQLWADTYERRISGIFAIQIEVALNIVAALKAKLSRDELSRLRRVATSDVQAYRLLLEGRQCFIRSTPDSLTRAIEYFEQAIARDPEFALAFAHLANAYTELTETGSISPETAYRRAEEAAATALKLDPHLGEAYCTMGFLRMVRDFDWAGAEQDFRKALELNPGGADTYDLYGRFCAALGRYDEAIVLQERAQELDPLAHRLDLVTALLRAGRYDEALARAVEALGPDFTDLSGRAASTLGWACFLSGKEEEGLAQLERAVSGSAGDTLWLGQLGQAYALAGQPEEARKVLEELGRLARTGYVSPYHFAYVHAGLGEADKAMDCLERAVSDRAGPSYGIKGSFLFTSLRDHPRFRAMLRRMNLP